MRRISAILVTAVMVGGGSAQAGAFSSLVRSETALANAKSWRVVTQMPGGKTLTMDYSAPNRWRLRAAPGITEVIIGDAVYVDAAGHVMKLPATYAAKIAGKIHIHLFDKAELAQVRRTLRDLGVQKLGGESVHVYRFVLKGVTQTWYVGANHLPVRAVLRGVGKHQVVQYSRFNVPVSIQVPAA